MAQQQADALQLLAETALHHGIDPGTPAEYYQVVVHVDATVLEDPDQPGQSVLAAQRLRAHPRDDAPARRPGDRADVRADRASVGRATTGTGGVVAPGREQIELRDVLQRLALTHRHYGYRRLTALLRREGWAVNHKRVLRLMRTDNLLCLRRRAFVPATTDSRHDWRVVPNLARGMQVTGLDQLWVADITYLRLLEEFAFLAVVLDAFSRRVVGWAVDVHLRAALAVAALQMALTARASPAGAVDSSLRPRRAGRVQVVVATP